jgi:molybdopterin-guanine dinucleotide biosynthesis protein A
MPSSLRATATGAVMAGGKSSRFGRDKALLTVNGETLLARALRVLAGVTEEQIVIGPPERKSQAGTVQVVPDEYPESGPLGGIYTALHAASHELLLVVACDMPFLNPHLLAFLLTLAPDYDVVLPRPDGRGEQLHAVYRRSCLDPIRRQLDRGDFKVDRFFGEVRVRFVDEDELRRCDGDLRSFQNVNTIEDWAEAQALLPT